MTTYRTTVHLTVDGPRKALPAVEVMLYDRDRFSADDLLGSATTDGSGRATITFSLADYTDGHLHDDPPPGRPPAVADVLPDLYVAVRNGHGKSVFTTRSRTRENTPVRSIHVRVPRRLAESAGLLKQKPRATQQQKGEHLDRLLRDLAATSGPAATCLTMLALDTVANLQSPTTSLHKRAAKAVAARTELTPALLSEVCGLAAQGRARVQASPVVDLSGCPDDGRIESLAAMMLASDPTVSSLAQALMTDIPSPDAHLGDPQPGAAITGTWQDWGDKKPPTCVWRYLEGDLEDPVALEQMKKYYPHGIEIVERPRVNLIQVWDNRYGTGQYEREADVAAKRLTYRTLDVTQGDVGWHERAVDMAVPLDHEDCLVLRQDQSDEPMQILAVDLVPGQKVVLRGSGFMSGTATVRVRFFPWRDDPADEEGRLHTDDDSSRWVTGWDGTTVDVHGSADPAVEAGAPVSHTKDRIVFDWPDVAADRGLYRLTFEFTNPTGKAVTVTQDPETCRFELDSRALTSELWFAVLPPVARRRAVVRASKVTCVEVTQPQWWPDDLSYQVTGALQRFVLTAGAAGGELAAGSPTVVSGGKVFFGPLEWVPSPSLEPVPAPGSTAPTLDPLDVVFAVLLPMEIPGALDKGVLSVLALVIVVVVLLLLALLLAALLALLAIPGFGWSAALGLIGGALLSGTVLGAQAATVTAILHSFVGVDELGQAVVAVQGNEYNHRLSPVRFHRMLWTQARPSQPSPGTRVLQTVTIGGALRETYRCRAYGGEYHLELTMRP